MWRPAKFHFVMIPKRLSELVCAEIEGILSACRLDLCGLWVRLLFQARDIYIWIYRESNANSYHLQ